MLAGQIKAKSYILNVEVQLLWIVADPKASLLLY